MGTRFKYNGLGKKCTTQCFTATKNGNDPTIDQYGLLIDINAGIARNSSAIYFYIASGINETNFMNIEFDEKRRLISRTQYTNRYNLLGHTYNYIE